MSDHNGNLPRSKDYFTRTTGIFWTDNDDEAAELEFNLHTLLGLQIISVKTIEEAKKVLKEKTINIVISDAKINYIRPWDLCIYIKSNEQYRNIPVLVLLDEKDKKNRTVALNYGADDFLVRPFENSDIYNRMRAQLRIHELHTKVLEAEREKVLLEMAGAAAHELAQPITSGMGLIQIILAKNEMNNQKTEFDKEMKLLYECLQRMTEVIHKIQRIRKYETTPYAGAYQIIDIDKASGSKQT